MLAVLALRYAPTIAGGWYAFTNWTGGIVRREMGGPRQLQGGLQRPGDAQCPLAHARARGHVRRARQRHRAVPRACLNRKLKTRNLLRALFFLPFALSELATAYIWQYVFQYNGPFNSFLGTIGLGSLRRPWLADPHFALYAVLVVLVWQFTGLTMVIYLAGLQAIPEELDRCDGGRRCLALGSGSVSVTLPLLAPAITVTSTLTLIFGLSVF